LPATTQPPAEATPRTRRLAALGSIAVAALAVFLLSYARKAASASAGLQAPQSLAVDDRASPSLAETAREESVPVPSSPTLPPNDVRPDVAGERLSPAIEPPSLLPPPPLPARAGDAPAPLSAPQGDEGHATSLDEDALGEMHTRWKTMARGCYDVANARAPGMAGNLVFHTVIVGDATVGGVVESVDLDEDRSIDDAELVACLRESILTLKFPPPRGGAWYRFDFPASFGTDAGIEGR
jgi:hypothetical protein